MDQLPVNDGFKQGMAGPRLSPAAHTLENRFFHNTQKLAQRGFLTYIRVCAVLVATLIS